MLEASQFLKLLQIAEKDGACLYLSKDFFPVKVF